MSEGQELQEIVFFEGDRVKAKRFCLYIGDNRSLERKG